MCKCPRCEDERERINGSLKHKLAKILRNF